MQRRLKGYGDVIRERVTAFAQDYTGYFKANDARDDVKRIMLDPMPRLTLVPGLGMFGHGRTCKDAKIAADVGEIWIEAIVGAEAIGSFRPLSHDELFRLEYWSLEQAKLASAKPKALTGNVVVVTGGAGAIGAATARLFAEQGAHVAVLDLDADRAKEIAKKAGNNSLGIGCDVTDRAPCGQRSTPSLPAMAALISRSPTRARPGKARSATSTTRCCARVLS